MLLNRYFRQARPASAAWNLLKTLLQSRVFWGVFLVLLPGVMIWLHSQVSLALLHFPGQIPLALVLFLLFSALNVWSAVTMAVVGRGTPLPTDCPRQLVIAGPYRYVRNPMAIGGLGQGLAIGIGVGATLMLVAVAAGGLLWNYVVRPVEETHLAAMFGPEFDEYRQQVRCWLPRWSPYHA